MVDEIAEVKLTPVQQLALSEKRHRNNLLRVKVFQKRIDAGPQGEDAVSAMRFRRARVGLAGAQAAAMETHREVEAILKTIQSEFKFT